MQKVFQVFSSVYLISSFDQLGEKVSADESFVSGDQGAHLSPSQRGQKYLAAVFQPVQAMDLLTALVGGCNPIGLVFEAKANAFSQLLGPAAVVEVSFQVFEVLVFSDGGCDQKRTAGQNFINLGHG